MDQNRLASFLDNALDAESRASVLAELERDPQALRFVTQQQTIDRVLRSVLAPPTQRQRLKDSILVAVAGLPAQELQTRVLADISHPPRGSAVRVSALQGHLRRAKSRIVNLLTASRQFGLAWSACLLLLTAVGIWLVFRAAPEQPVVVGRFAALIGEPKVKRGPRQSTYRPLPTSPVHLGDRIETGDADKAELIFQDGTILRLNFNTSIEIPPLKDKKPAPLRPPQINLHSGQVWTKVQKLTNAPRYAIWTEAATAVARGTEFGLKVQGPGPGASSRPVTTLSVREGAVGFSNSVGSVEASAMTESTATAGTAPSEPVPLRTLKHISVAAGKHLVVEGLSSPLGDHSPWDYRMVYPQGWAGFTVQALQETGSVRQLRVVRVWPGSPAEAAGISVGDMITGVNGRGVMNQEEVLRPIYQQQGSRLAVDLSREGVSRTTSLVTTNHPYALPVSWQMSPGLKTAVTDATWPLIEADAQLRIDRNEWNKLATQLRDLLALHPRVDALHNNLGVWYDLNGEPGPAVQHLKEAIAADPDNPLYRYNLSQVLARLGNFDRSIEEAQKVAELVPSWVPAVVLLADVYSLFERYDAAIAALKGGLAANPADPELWANMPALYLSMANREEALNAALRAVELEPSNAAWWTCLGQVHWARGEGEQAEAAYRKALELNPGQAGAYESLAIHLITSRLGNRFSEDVVEARPEDLALERWRSRPADELAVIYEAERFMRNAIRLSPGSPNHYVTLGQILMLRGAIEEAEPIMRKAVEMDPGGLTAAKSYNDLAWRFAVWGIRLEEALQLARNAVEIDPAPTHFDTLATVHFQRGEWDQAEVAWKKGLELAGPQGDPWYWYRLGKVYERKSQTNLAIRAYQETLRLQPDHSGALRALSSLRK